jgi:hypothetical protein
MAEDTLRKLRDDLTAITEENRKAYDAFHQRGYLPTGESLEQAYKIALREKNDKDIAKYKPLYEAAQVEYNKTQTKKNELAKSVKAAEKAEKDKKTKEKTASAASDTYQKALDKLTTAEVGLVGYQGEEKYKAAYQEARNAYDAAVAAGKTPTPLPEAKITVPVVEKKAEVQKDASGKVITTSTEPTLTEILNTLSDPANSAILKQYQTDLKTNFSNFYKGGTGGLSDWNATQNAITTILEQRGQLPTNLKGADLRTFITDPKNAQLISNSKTGTGGPTIRMNISDDTQASAYIKDAFKTNLGREATPDEIAKYAKVLQAAQRKNPYKTNNGVTTGGINEGEFLAQQLQKLPEYATKKAEKTDIVKQDVLKLMRANGLPANQDQVNNFATAIQNGTTLDTIAKQIRQVAGAGLPDNIKNLLAQGIDLDTVYSPYKSTMASTLELNPNDIQLNDPTLRLALGPDKEMSIYDFQKILKKDNRWQYTTNAKEEISNSVQKVLQDFGFQG